MKKQYIEPGTYMIAVTVAESMLAGSAKGTNVYFDSPAGEGVEGLGRSHTSVWDDDEDDDIFDF